MNITERLKNLREEKNLRIYDISAFLEIDKDLYGKYERQNVIIPIKHLIAVSNFFNVSIDYIFSFSDTKKYISSINDISLNVIGQRLKEFRKENKITQAKLADTLNTNQSVIANYERGRNIIATPFLYEICKKYKISADYLLGKIDNPKYLKKI